MPRTTNYTEAQDLEIARVVKEGGFNNLQSVFERLSQTALFAGRTAISIHFRYYRHVRRNIPMFQIVGSDGVVAVLNYKNDPQHWTGATRRNWGS